MAPEIFKKEGHSKPVDIWAMGVITYFLLCGAFFPLIEGGEDVS
jgi:serine/threonine protein kinase